MMEAIAQIEAECPGCGKPMYVAAGQVMLCHKACKKKVKDILRKQKQHGVEYEITTKEV